MTAGTVIHHYFDSPPLSGENDVAPLWCLRRALALPTLPTLITGALWLSPMRALSTVMGVFRFDRLPPSAIG
jgi:hypothetical protein